MSEKDTAGIAGSTSNSELNDALGTGLVRIEHYLQGKPQFVSMWIGKERIGNAEKVATGWIVQGKRKPVATIKEAAKQMLDAKMNYFQCEKNRYHKLLQKVLST